MRPGAARKTREPAEGGDCGTSVKESLRGWPGKGTGTLHVSRGVEWTLAVAQVSKMWLVSPWAAAGPGSGGPGVPGRGHSEGSRRPWTVSLFFVFQ